MMRNVLCVCLYVCVCLMWGVGLSSASCGPINIAGPNVSDAYCKSADSPHVDTRGNAGHHETAPPPLHPQAKLSTITDDSTDRAQHDLSLLGLWPDGALLERSAGYIQNPTCRRDVKFFLSRVQQLDLWALKMMDSSGRIPSGLLNGNVNQLGDFDQCLSVTSPQESRNPEVKGKYCLASLDLRIPANPLLQDLLHSHGPIVSNLSDPGHRISRFSTVSWAFCIPSSCSAHDLEHVIVTWAANRVKDMRVTVKVEQEMCYTKETQPTSTAKYFVITLFCVILTITAIGTCMNDEVNNTMETGNNLENTIRTVLRCFSLRRNWATLFSTTTSKDDIKCLHGIRALSALALVIFHKSCAIMFNPYINRTAMAKSLGLAWSVIGRTSVIYTDSFILLSGLLTAYGLLKELDKKGRVDLKERYWARVCRIVPSLLALILFGTYIMADLGSGPQWGLVVKHHSDLCKKNMWRNFLFIHNYFGLENMCFTHTHQLGIDMQLFAVSPLLVWLLWRHRTAGALVLAAVGLASTVLRYTVALHNQLSPVLYFGVSVSQMISTANLSYIIPSHRITVYVFGLGLGYFMKRIGTVTLSRLQVGVAWIAAFAVGLYAMCGPYEMARRGYEYSASDAAFWNAGAPIMWSVFLSIGIVLCTSGYGGKLGEFLAWRGFVVFTRLAYAVYLTQFPIFFYSVGSQRAAELYTPFMLANLTEIGVILITSTALTLLFDLPFQQLKKTTWRSPIKKAAENETNNMEHTNKTSDTSKAKWESSESEVLLRKGFCTVRKGTRGASSG